MLSATMPFASLGSDGVDGFIGIHIKFGVTADGVAKIGAFVSDVPLILRILVPSVLAVL